MTKNGPKGSFLKCGSICNASDISNGEGVICRLVEICSVFWLTKFGGGRENAPRFRRPCWWCMHFLIKSSKTRGQIEKLLLMKKEIHNFKLKFYKTWQNDWHLILDSSRFQCLCHLAKQPKIMHQRVRKNVKLKWYLKSSVCT